MNRVGQVQLFEVGVILAALDFDSVSFQQLHQELLTRRV
jgi:hypothetical protein